MVSILGLIAVIFIFLAGPYRTFQKGRSKTPQGEVRGRALPGSDRWGGRIWGGGASRWGPVMSVFSHANVSSAAMLFVGIHVLANFQIGVGLTYVATLIFGLSFLSGLFGFFLTRTPTRRRRWLWFHRRLTVLFYATIIFHVITKGALGLSAIGLLAFAWVLWKRRAPLARLLARWNWPFHHRRPPRSSGRSQHDPQGEIARHVAGAKPSTTPLRVPPHETVRTTH